MSDSPTIPDDAAQSTLTGEEAEHVECEYYDGCPNDALYVDEVLTYDEGEVTVRMCKGCAEEHMEVQGNEVQRLKPEDRYVGDDADEETVWVVASHKMDDPHPHVEGVYDNEDAAREHKRELADNAFKHDVVAWDMFERQVNGEVQSEVKR